MLGFISSYDGLWEWREGFRRSLDSRALGLEPGTEAWIVSRRGLNSRVMCVVECKLETRGYWCTRRLWTTTGFPERHTKTVVEAPWVPTSTWFLGGFEVLLGFHGVRSR